MTSSLDSRSSWAPSAYIRCPKSGRRPAGFRCFPASTHLIQMKWISSKDCWVLHKPADDALIWIRCVEAGKHGKPAGQRPSRTDFGHPCLHETQTFIELLSLNALKSSWILKNKPKKFTSWHKVLSSLYRNSALTPCSHSTDPLTQLWAQTASYNQGENAQPHKITQKQRPLPAPSPALHSCITEAGSLISCHWTVDGGRKGRMRDCWNY